MLKKLLIASSNPAKIDRYRNLLNGLVSEIVTPKDIGIFEKPEESGKTAEENAAIKANFYAERSTLPTLAEDESLFVDFLLEDEQPGVHVRRINQKDDATDEELIGYWSEKTKLTPENKRTGRWHFALCLKIPGEDAKIVTVEFPTKFYYPPSKNRIVGWPMSSVQGSAVINKPHSDRTERENKLANQERDKIILDGFAHLLQIN